MEGTHLMETFVSAAWLTDVGRMRNNNEDALIVADLSERKVVNDSGEASLRRIGERGWLLAVADGMGGAQAGEVASHIATERLVQTMVQTLIDAGVLTPEEATHSSQRNVILKALGAKDEIEPDLSRVGLSRGDHLLLCSDGLSNKIDAVEMRDIALKANTLDAACARLVALANDRGGEDNITVILARFDGMGLPALGRSADQHILVERL